MNPTHILIAEDEKHARLTLSLTLRQAGYRISVAGNGREALEAITASTRGPEPVELLISDIQMPDLDGLGLMDGLRQRGIAIPVIGISGFGDKNLLMELLRRGCRDYLDKPFTPEEVVARVAKVLRQSEAVREGDAIRFRRLRKDRRRIRRQIDDDRERFEELLRQFDSAVDAYRAIMNGNTRSDKLPLASRHLPLTGLGGDYLEIRETEVGCDILLADVGGHDVAASFNAVLIKTFFEENCRKLMDLQTFLRLLNLHLYDRGQKGRPIAALFLRLDLEGGKGYLAAAGNPILVAAGAGCRPPRVLQAEGSSLGEVEEIDFSIRQFPLAPGDRHFMCSDGVAAALAAGHSGGEGETAGLSDLVREAGGKPIALAVQNIWETVLASCGEQPADDLTLLGLEIPGENACST
ncbi:MAG: SpoIIE family protein phosphatase [Desulfobacteraceae bacterium]|nr:SpoIIE family protein phosphatase [Desulfobacteraceae bacterium]